MDIGSIYTTEDDVATYGKMHRMALLIDGLAEERERLTKRITELQEKLDQALEKPNEAE